MEELVIIVLYCCFLLVSRGMVYGFVLFFVKDLSMMLFVYWIKIRRFFIDVNEIVFKFYRGELFDFI